MHYDPISRWEQSRYGGYRHGLLVKIGSRSQSCCTFEVTAARLACDDHRIRCNVDGVAADVYSYVQRLSSAECGNGWEVGAVVNAVCAILRKRGPMSLMRDTRTSANSLAADPLCPGAPRLQR